jgi:hypothetical protein
MNAREIEKGEFYRYTSDFGMIKYDFVFRLTDIIFEDDDNEYILHYELIADYSADHSIAKTDIFYSYAELEGKNYSPSQRFQHEDFSPLRGEFLKTYRQMYKLQYQL